MTRCICSVLVFFLSLLCFSEGSTYFMFERSVDSCDPFGDLTYDGTVKIIWAYNDEDPRSMETIPQHPPHQKGSTPVNFETSQLANEELEPDTKTIELRRPNIPIPFGTRKISHESTYYTSGGVDLWALFGDMGVHVNSHKGIHITKWSMVFDNFVNVHHLNVIPCPEIANCTECLGESSWGESGTYGREGEDTVSKVLDNCWLQNGTAPVMAWVLGTKPQQFPKEAGLLVGGPGGLRYVMLGIHYDIPSYDPPEVRDATFGEKTAPPGWRPERIISDNSGVKMWFTETLRPHNIGYSWFGINPDRDVIVIPPGQPNYIAFSLTNPHCWDPYFPKSGEVKVIQVLLHGHDQAVAIRIRHFRGNKELPNVAYDPRYNNYYQQWITREFTWKKGDQFLVECTIDSTAFTRPLTFGVETAEQMCIGMFMLYPSLGVSTRIEWTLHRPDIEPGLFISNPGDLSPCLNESYYFPTDFIPLQEETKCKKHIPPTQPIPQHIDRSDIDFSSFPNHIVLDSCQQTHDKFNTCGDEGKFHLYWRYDMNEKKVFFLADVDTTGWLAVGVSPNGGMPDSDIALMWVDDESGEPQFSDMQANCFCLPEGDISQDVIFTHFGQDGVEPPLVVRDVVPDDVVSANESVMTASNTSSSNALLIILTILGLLTLLVTGGILFVFVKSKKAGGYLRTTQIDLEI